QLVDALRVPEDGLVLFVRDLGADHHSSVVDAEPSAGPPPVEAREAVGGRVDAARVGRGPKCLAVGEAGDLAPVVDREGAALPSAERADGVEVAVLPEGPLVADAAEIDDVTDHLAAVVE